MAEGVVYKIDINDIASSKVKSLTDNFSAADRIINKFNTSLKQSVEGNAGALDRMKGATEANTTALGALSDKATQASNKLNNLKTNANIGGDVKGISRGFDSATHSVGKLGASLSNVSINSLTAKLNSLRSARDNIDINSKAFKDLSKEIKAAEGKLSELSNTAQTSSGIMGIAYGAAAYSGIRYMIGGVKDAIAAQIELEMAVTKFSVLMGSTFKGNKLVDWATQFANVTPLMRKDILSVSATLLQYGLVENEVKDSIKALGDISGGSAENMQRLGLAYGQVKAAGRLRGQELLQMINAGYNPMQKLSEMTGKSMSQLRDEMSKGLITFEMVAKALKKDTDVGGKFHGMLNKMSQTVGGKLSTLSDAYNTKLSLMGKRFEGVTKWGAEFATTLVNTEGALEAVTVAVGAFTVAMAIAALRATAFGSAILTSSAALLTNPYVIAIAGLTALGVAVYGVTKKYQELSFSVADAFKNIQKIGTEQTGVSIEKDATKKKEFQDSKERADYLKIVIGSKKRRGEGTAEEEREIAGIAENHKQIAKYYFDRYGHDIIDGNKQLNGALGSNWKQALELMESHSYEFFDRISRGQKFIAEGLGNKTTLNELRSFLDAQKLTEEQWKAVEEGDDKAIDKVFPYNKNILGLFKESTQKAADLNKAAKEYNLLLKRGTVYEKLRMSFEPFKDKPQEAAATADMDSQINALQTGIVTGGSRTTNINIYPAKAMLNIEQWLGDTKEKVLESGGMVAEELNRILASFIPSAI